jgi:hypothetical protein
LAKSMLTRYSLESKTAARFCMYVWLVSIT